MNPQELRRRVEEIVNCGFDREAKRIVATQALLSLLRERDKEVVERLRTHIRGMDVAFSGSGDSRGFLSRDSVLQAFDLEAERIMKLE